MTSVLCAIRYAAYKLSKSTPSTSQPPISQFMNSGVQHYSSTHPQQKAITNAILSDLVIDCNLPLSIVEHDSFWHFMRLVDGKYNPVCRRTLTAKTENLAAETLKIEN